MRIGVLVCLVVFGCQHEPGSGSNGAAASATPVADEPWAETPVAADPWGGNASRSAAVPTTSRSAAVPKTSWPPPLADRHARAERLCPTVKPYFFAVEKAGKTSYILGTRHVGVPLAKLPQVVRDDLHAAKLAVFEVAPDDKSSFEPPEEPLRDELGSADWQHFADLVGQQTASALVTGTASAATLALAIELEDTSAFLDKEIQDDAAAAGIPVRGLETAAFQDRILAKLLDLRMLRATIKTTKDRAEIDHDAAKDLREYCEGTNDAPGTDADTRAKLRRAGYTAREIDAQDEVLVYSRNRDWIPKLEELFARGDVFVAVGADHLIGERGIIALLRARGFTAKRITR